MSDSVIHVSQEAHAAVRRCCRVSGVRVKAWASRVLLEAAERAERTRTIKLTAVSDEPWLRPPFWENRCSTR